MLGNWNIISKYKLGQQFYLRAFYFLLCIAVFAFLIVLLALFLLITIDRLADIPK